MRKKISISFYGNVILYTTNKMLLIFFFSTMFSIGIKGMENIMDFTYFYVRIIIFVLCTHNTHTHTLNPKCIVYKNLCSLFVLFRRYLYKHFHFVQAKSNIVFIDVSRKLYFNGIHIDFYYYYYYV